MWDLKGTQIYLTNFQNGNHEVHKFRVAYLLSFYKCYIFNLLHISCAIRIKKSTTFYFQIYFWDLSYIETI